MRRLFVSVLRLSWLAAASAKPPQFAGLRNAGSTCYLNSVLQTLFHVPPLREAALATVPAAPPPRRRPAWLGGARPKQDVPEALGTVFERLARNATGGTRELTRALGVRAYEQQDAQEYLRLVFDRLAGTQPAARALYEGTLESYLEVTQAEAARIGAPFSLARAERFLDVSLEVAGHADVYAALAAFLAPETLDGANKWRAGEHGLCDARKGVRFLALPPVLVLHLKRFAYDARSDTVEKLGQPLKFPFELDAARFFDGDGADYVLHAVVIHVGGGSAGHYFAYVDPQCDGQWLRFDDERVDTVDAARVARDGLGTAFSPSQSMGAYLLQYVRKTDVARLLRGHADTEL